MYEGREFAAAYERYRDPYPTSIFDRVVHYFPERRHAMLDLASGTGAFARKLAPWFTKIYAYDLSREMLDEGARISASEGLSHIEWIQGSAGALKSSLSPLDFVTIGNALHWIREELPAPRLRAYLSQTARVAAVTRKTFLAGTEPWKPVVRRLLFDHLKERDVNERSRIEKQIGDHCSYFEPHFSVLDEQDLPVTVAWAPQDYASFVSTTSIGKLLRLRYTWSAVEKTILEAIAPFLFHDRLHEEIVYRVTIAE